MAITLTEQHRARAIESIKRYFEEHMDEEVGDLKAGLLLDFVLEEIGPCVYNRAVSDAQTYFRDRAADLDGACYEPEFRYWRS